MKQVYSCLIESLTRNHGSIGVESQAGKGTTFWVRLPKDSIYSPAPK